MTASFSRRRFSALAAVGAAALAGLPRPARAQDVVNFQANWLNDPEFIGYMIAIDKGYYKAQGIGVNYMSGGPNLIPEGALLSGKADIALTNMLTTGRAIIDKGAPLVIIGTQYQKSPLGVISLASHAIKGPGDLAGKTVACPPLSQNIFTAMLKLAKVPLSDVRIVPFTFDPTPIINGSVDAAVDFVTQLPFLVEQKSGKKASYFLAYDHGLPFYIDLVVVTRDALKAKKRQLVEFLRASRQGWKENFADPKKYPALYENSWFKGLGSSPGAELYFNQTQLGLMEHPQGFYAMTDDGIARNIDALANVGITANRKMFDTSVLREL